MSFPPHYFRSQIFYTPPYPTTDFIGQTVIVTGANTGLGLEAARHLVRLNAGKVILAVRSLEKGEAARKSIEASEKKTDVAEVWKLDLASYESVKKFASKAQSLKRLDAVIENAAVYKFDFSVAEGNESTVTVNIFSTFLLALLLLPKMRETAVKFNVLPRLSIVASFVHYFTKFPERSSVSIFDNLNEKDKANMNDRYVFGPRSSLFTISLTILISPLRCQV